MTRRVVPVQTGRGLRGDPGSTCSRPLDPVPGRPPAAQAGTSQWRPLALQPGLVSEGWGIFECLGSSDGPVQIQRDDEQAVLDGDTDTSELVWRRAEEGSVIHQRALDLIVEQNRREYIAIRESMEAAPRHTHRG
jgi:hypothetical protein